MHRAVTENERTLGALLQVAYSGERAAAYAYRGHWRSSYNPDERDRIRTIEEEEWHHRHQVGEMLAELGLSPSSWRESKATFIGRSLGALCYVSGWFAPMYGAGKLECRNVNEYETAARYARDCDRDEWVDCLLTMAEVEWDHEYYFRSQVLTHWLGKLLPLWPIPAARENIRAAFQADSPASA